MNWAEANGVVLLMPNVPGSSDNELVPGGNNASENCNAGTPVAGNCKEIARGCWDGYGQLSQQYYMQSAAHMQTVYRMIKHVSGL